MPATSHGCSGHSGQGLRRFSASITGSARVHVSGPTRVQRFLSRFLVVVVVALAIEGLVATFKAAHEDPRQLYFASCIVASCGVLLAGWDLFIRFNSYAEKLEPEAMAEANQEGTKISSD